VIDEDARGVGESHAAAGALQERDAGFALEDGELLGDGGGGEAQRVSDGGDGSPLVQLAQESQGSVGGTV
jgi:hypothetical protein